MRAFFGMVHVLAADSEAWHRASRALDENRGHAQRHIHGRILPRFSRDRLDLHEVGRHSVHLPIARDELP
jgi:hypothetical protein